MTDDPTRCTVSGLLEIGILTGTLLAGEIAIQGEEPFANDGFPRRVTLSLKPEEAIRFGTWLAAAGRVARDLNIFASSPSTPDRR